MAARVGFGQLDKQSSWVNMYTLAMVQSHMLKLL
jgi:hypothetical protein